MTSANRSAKLKTIEKVYGVRITRTRRDTNWGSTKGYAASNEHGDAVEHGRDLPELVSRLAFRVRWNG